MQALGIMGGTFDPIHYGHLVTAEAARDAFGLSRVVFVPAGVPPHKAGKRITPARHRYLMAVLATVTNPFFEVSRVEIDRPGPSYTIDTIRILRRQWGKEPELYFITGADVVAELCAWNDPRGLLEEAHVIAASRPGYRLAVENLRDRLGAELLERIHTLEVPALAISSSDIRARVARGMPIKYLVPEVVEHYIAKNRLYGPDGGEEADG